MQKKKKKPCYTCYIQQICHANCRKKNLSFGISEAHVMAKIEKHSTSDMAKKIKICSICHGKCRKNCMVTWQKLGNISHLHGKSVYNCGKKMSHGNCQKLFGN